MTINKLKSHKSNHTMKKPANFNDTHLINPPTPDAELMETTLENYLTADVMNEIELQIGTFHENFNEAATDHCIAKIASTEPGCAIIQSGDLNRDDISSFVKNYYGY